MGAAQTRLGHVATHVPASQISFDSIIPQSRVSRSTEEVAEVYPELVAYEKDGSPYSVKYQYLTSMLLNEVQKQYHRAEAEANVVVEQQDRIEQLEQRLDRLEKQLDSQAEMAQTATNVLALPCYPAGS